MPKTKGWFINTLEVDGVWWFISKKKAKQTAVIFYADRNQKEKELYLTFNAN